MPEQSESKIFIIFTTIVQAMKKGWEITNINYFHNSYIQDIGLQKTQLGKQGPSEVGLAA
jgi:hypothetical protein